YNRLGISYTHTAYGTDETGIYLGSRGSGTTTGFPCYWGMRYPMNNATQNSAGGAKNNLLQLCWDVINNKGNHPNYEYMRPVAGTDFFRLDDFVGYQHGAEAFLDAGVQGATAGNGTYATLRVNRFENSGIAVYAIIPSDSVGWEFKDIIPEANKYKLVAEFYKNDTANVWKSGSTAAPFLTVQSTKYMDNWSGMQTYFGVSLADILAALGNTGTTTPSFFVCVGFNKYQSATADFSSAFVAPWKSNRIRCVTLVTVVQASPYVLSLLKYSWNSTSYVSFVSSDVTAQSPTMRFQVTVANNGSTTMHIGIGSADADKLLFAAQAWGSYGAYHDFNGGFLADGGTDNHGPMRVMKVGTNTDLSSNTNNVSINANSSKTLYFQADDLLPFGHTTSILIWVSNDGGTTWENTGTQQVSFKNLNA
ncbi:MAG: hypothetical protein K2L00_05435, partial [Muribaculaceae bacterium]|nr:hypothetical protein [Muribaculaceae bacterium]